MFCSTIIPTIARPTLARAVNSVLTQNFTSDEFEVIVVNDSGKPLPKENWQLDRRVKVINTNHRERIFARNTGASLAKGRYLHFLDDDDWLLPGALENFYQLAQKSMALWLYGSSQLIDRQGCPLIQLHHNMGGNCFVQVMAGEWIPLQSSLIDAEAFCAVGGFAPNCLATQDVDLCRRIALIGDLIGTDSLVSCIGMGSQGSSTDYKRAHEYSRRARESILESGGVWSRLHRSAHSSEWRGKISRIYMTSTIWNLQHRKFAIALTRVTTGAASFIFAGRHLFSLAFWNALTHHYSSPTFERGFEEVKLRLATG